MRGATQERPCLDCGKQTVVRKTIQQTKHQETEVVAATPVRYFGLLEEKETWVDSPIEMRRFHGKDCYRTYNMAC